MDAPVGLACGPPILPFLPEPSSRIRHLSLFFIMKLSCIFPFHRCNFIIRICSFRSLQTQYLSMDAHIYQVFAFPNLTSIGLHKDFIQCGFLFQSAFHAVISHPTVLNCLKISTIRFSMALMQGDLSMFYHGPYCHNNYSSPHPHRMFQPPVLMVLFSGKIFLYSCKELHLVCLRGTL